MAGLAFDRPLLASTGGKPVVAEQNLGRVANSQRVWGNVGDNEAIGGHRRTLADRYALHDMRSIPDERIAADSHRPYIFRAGRDAGGAEIRFPAVTIRVGNPAIVGDQHVLLDDHFLANRKLGVPPDGAPVLENQVRLVAGASRDDRNVGAQLHVISDMDCQVPAHEGEPFEHYAMPKTGTTSLKQGVAVADREQRPAKGYGQKMQFIGDAQRPKQQSG